ncbi:UNVERIFIED_CONTAM: hypothetical protein Sradi_0177600 [Sesamum radiatum]|uniref:Uncharacterized protein n=1 Tax=Sesamum radiatum TaxID=300843 RepID=A0AAW2VYP7_SESRA
MSENKDIWEWFLALLKEDLNIIWDDAYTFISDKQKGLLLAFEKVLPAVENKFYVRHLHGNMKTAGFKGLGYKKALWKTTKTTTISQFQKAIQDIADLDVRSVQWLQDKPASCILEAREKPILTMLEWIREYVMIRLQQLRDRLRGQNTKGCKWKKFAIEFPVGDVFEQAAETEQHVTTPVQQDENMKKPVKIAIFKDVDQAPVVVQTMHFHDANPKHIYPTSVSPPGFMHTRVNIRAPSPMVGRAPDFVSRPTTGPSVPYPNGDIII